MTEREKGKVKFFSHQKGYGFIIPDNGDKELFIHITQLPRNSRIEKDDIVTYEKVETEKGLEAHEIRLVD